MQNIIFEPDALEDFVNWGIYDSRKFKKIFEIIKDIKRNPFDGIGKPEALKNELSGLWSRRIDEKHRLVYFISDDNQIQIISCKGHYLDK